mgnify:CR=1 FL=1
MTLEERYQHSYLMLQHWIEALYLGHRVSEYFEEEGINNIAIYGMGDLANRLMDDLEQSNIIVNYGIDRDAAGTVCRMENIYSPEAQLPATEAIVVTPFYSFETISDMLREKTEARIISIEEVIWSL